MKQDDTLASSSAPAAPQGLGPTLRSLRESKSLSVAAVSARLKFSPRQIEALEAENWQALPKGLPLRGLVKNYARLLETDAEALAVLLDASTQQGHLSHQTLASSPAARSMGSMEKPRSSRGSWGWMFIVLVLVLVVLFYALDRGWLPESWLVSQWFNDVSQP
ncbi:helix-turn-helix domain-containing protein [Pusillimonas sp. CC-YST705]|uniref:Helix-turn-helix domain-containing protein n=1 Tax=Mesopusillimonas faecipullorum TaxID=2755040 RepID=A0ABS8CA76_9BURK|nr:helix-turn-helix transcriptional regulator [Mesopusillimonas faecipullorum]MCB5362936.1 helix-turn-helix domain-containing protein [Mesopusillimonas faecipullorum]